MINQLEEELDKKVVKEDLSRWYHELLEAHKHLQKIALEFKRIYENLD